MTGAIDFSGRELLRWSASAALILVVHAACAAAVVRWQHSIVEPSETAGAVFVDLAPETTSAPAPDVALPPGPQPVEADTAPPPETVVEQPTERKTEIKADAESAEEPLQEQPKVETAEVTLPAPAMKQPVEPPNVETAPPAPETTAPQAITAPQATVTAAPTPSVPTARTSDALPQWSGRIAVLLERNKRYPASARARREAGVTHVSFVLDRQGRLVSSRVEQSSGVAALDQEALDLLRRAQPFPALPAEVADTQVSLTVPIKFALR